MSTAMISAFPLCWPDGWPRTKSRRTSPYKVTTDAAITELLGGLRLMGARDIIISSNVPLRRDGTMYRGDHSDQRLGDPGVAVYWDAPNKNGYTAPRVIPCDVWHTVRENVRALGLAIDYLRGLQRTGAGEILDRAFLGFARLPETTGGERSWWQVLGVERDADARYIRGVYRSLAAEHHPDKGGAAATMAQINDAFRQATAERADLAP